MLADKSDYALYIMHMPIPSLHPNAELMAKIFEAGMQMGKNFKNDLFELDTPKLLEEKAKEYIKANNITEFTQADIDKIIALFQEDLINMFASKTIDAQKFKELVASKAIEEKINLMQNIKLLLDNEPNVDMVDTNKQSALHKICQSGNLILFNEILKLNPKINQIDVNGNTPFQYIPASANVPLYITAREYLKSNKIIRN